MTVTTRERQFARPALRMSPDVEVLIEAVLFRFRGRGTHLRVFCRGLGSDIDINFSGTGKNSGRLNGLASSEVECTQRAQM
jgi:hypothetical protein